MATIMLFSTTECCNVSYKITSIHVLASFFVLFYITTDKSVLHGRDE